MRARRSSSAFGRVENKGIVATSSTVSMARDFLLQIRSTHGTRETAERTVSYRLSSFAVFRCGLMVVMLTSFTSLKLSAMAVASLLNDQ